MVSQKKKKSARCIWLTFMIPYKHKVHLTVLLKRKVKFIPSLIFPTKKRCGVCGYKFGGVNSQILQTSNVSYFPSISFILCATSFIHSHSNLISLISQSFSTQVIFHVRFIYSITLQTFQLISI